MRPGPEVQTAAIDVLFEETGILAKAEDLEPFATLSDPLIQTLTYPNGDQPAIDTSQLLAVRSFCRDSAAISHPGLVRRLPSDDVHGLGL